MGKVNIVQSYIVQILGAVTCPVDAPDSFGFTSKMELIVGASTSQLQELQVPLQVYSSRKIRLACIKVCEKNFVSVLLLFNDSRKPAPVSQIPIEDTDFVNLQLKEPKVPNLPNQLNKPNVTPFTYPEGRQCPNGSQSNQQQNAPSSDESNVLANSPTQSNESISSPPGGPSHNPLQSENPREPGSGSDPPDPDPDSDPDPDEPDSNCPIGEPNCPICFYFDQRKIAIFGPKDGGRKSPNMELLFKEPIFTSQSQSSLPNVFGLDFTSQQQQFATSAGPSNLPTTSSSSSQPQQPIRTDVCSEQDLSSSSLLSNVGVVLSQFEQSQSSSLNPEFKVPEAQAYEPNPHSLFQINVPIFRPFAAVPTSPLQQQRLIEFESSSNVPTTQTFDPQIQQSVHGDESHLYQQTSSSPIPTHPSESRRTFLKSPLRVPKFTPSQPQSVGTPLQQLEHLATGGPRASRFSSQVEQVVRANESSSAGSLQNIRTQSEPPRGILLEPLLNVPSVTPSQSMGTNTKELDSPLQQLQYFSRSRRGSVDVPRTLDFVPQLLRPVRTRESEFYEQRSLLERSLTDIPSIRNILPQRSSVLTDTSIQVPEVPVHEPEMKRREIDSSSQFNVPQIRPSQLHSNSTSMPAFGSALQQQQYFTFAGQSRVPTAETIHSQLRQPVRASVSQLFERRASLRRHSISIPHTPTMLPRFNEPTSFEPVLRVPNVLRFRSRPSNFATNVSDFGSVLQQQQSVSLRNQLITPRARSFRLQVQQQIRMYGFQLYGESRSSMGSLSLPTSQPQFRITSPIGTPLEQLEILSSKGPERSDFNSQVQQLVSADDLELYDQRSSLAGSLTDVSSIQHVLPQSKTHRSAPIETQPPELRPISQQQPSLSFMGPLDVPTPPVFTSQSQQTVRAKRIQRKPSSTASLIDVPSVRAVLPYFRESRSQSERQPKKNDSFSIASLLDLPEAQPDLPQSEEQQLDVPRVPPSQPIVRKPTPPSDVLSVRFSQPRSRTADLPTFGLPLQQEQQQFVALGSQLREPETEALDPQFQQSVHLYGSRLYQQRPSPLVTRLDAPKVLPQSSEPQIRIRSVAPSRPRSSITSIPVFGSALQQQQYFAFGSQSNVPTARTTYSQLQEPVRASDPQLYERPSLRRASISLPHTTTLLSQSMGPRDPSFASPVKVPTTTHSQFQSSATNIPVCGSVVQQQPYFTFVSQSNVPTVRTTHSQLRPVRASVPQLYEQSPSLRRHSISIPHTLTMLPRSNEPTYTSFKPPVKVPRLAFSQSQPNITNLSVFGPAIQQQQSLAFGAQSSVPTQQTLIPQLQQSVHTRGIQSYEQNSGLPSSIDPALAIRRFGAPGAISSQPPRNHADLSFGSFPQQQSLIPFIGQSTVPTTQNISQSFPQISSSVGPHFEAPNVPATLPSLEPKIIVTKVPAYRPQLNTPIALSLPYLDLPKVSSIGPQLRAHEESAFRAVALPPRTDTIFDIGNLRGTGLPELRRTNLRFANLVHTPRRL